MKSYRARAETQQFALMVLIRPLHSEPWLVRGGDPAVCAHRVEQFAALRGLEGSCWEEIQQVAPIGLSNSLPSEAWGASAGRRSSSLRS